jgi:hypothetical protein
LPLLGFDLSSTDDRLATPWPTRKFLIALILLGLSTARAAAVSEMDYDTFAKRLKAYDRVQLLEAKFTQSRVVPGLNLEVTAAGVMVWERGARRVTWRIDKPARWVIEVTDKQISVTSGPADKVKTQRFEMAQVPDDFKIFVDAWPWLTLNAQRIFETHRIVSTAEREFRFEPRPESEGRPEMIMKLRWTDRIQLLRWKKSPGGEVTWRFAEPYKLEYSKP